jgi:hypothetical protein
MVFVIFLEWWGGGGCYSILTAFIADITTAAVFLDLLIGTEWF